ncbi:uncharacterized protein [Montipora capricornis]|uniref:uncharacterized protein n=1 Tax=Montipora foliosa TaxID=591990 RepID=UPI0035F10302
MSPESLNILTDELRQEYKIAVINVFNNLKEQEREMLRFYYDERIPGNLLDALETTGKISWRDVASLKKALREAIKRDKLASDLEEYEMKRDLAFFLDTYVRKKLGLNDKRSCLPAKSMIEDVAEYLAKIADGVLDKTTVESLRKSRKNIQELMGDLEEEMKDKLSDAWSKLALLTIVVGDVIADIETTKEECGPKAEVLKSFSAEICSRMKKGQITMEKFCRHVKDRFNEVYNDHDSNGNTTSSRQIVVDVVDQLIQTTFFRQ